MNHLIVCEDQGRVHPHYYKQSWQIMFPTPSTLDVESIDGGIFQMGHKLIVAGSLKVWIIIKFKAKYSQQQ